MKKILTILGALAVVAMFSMGATIDTYSGSNATPSKYSVADSADTNGVGVDLWGYYGALVVVEVGAAGSTFLADSTVLELELEESADNSSFTDVADAHLVGYVAGTNDGCFGVVNAAADDSTTYYASYIGSLRYIRIVTNYTGDAPDGITPVSGTVIRMHPMYGPAH